MKPKLGISSCLVGKSVRYDGKVIDYFELVNQLYDYFELVSVCPEVLAGLTTPRPPMDLFCVGGEVRMKVISSKVDVTDLIRNAIGQILDSCLKEDVCGFVFKAKSPSCGISLARIHRGELVTNDGMGLFTRAFRDTFSDLPVATEIDLANAEYRQKFISSAQAIASGRMVRKV